MMRGSKILLMFLVTLAIADPAAGIIRLTASRNGRTFNTAERCILDEFELSAYAGVFTSVELQKSFRFEAADDVLKARDFLGESEALLTPLEKDLFGFRRGFMRLLMILK